MFGFNVEKYRKDFPFLGKPLIYLDNACMSLKPIQVIDKIVEYYKEYSGCAGRSAHSTAKKVQNEVDKSRQATRKFIHAAKDDEIVFTRNTTESINIIAHSYPFKKGDEIIISDKEHNSNLIPWLALGKKGVNVKFAKTNEDNILDMNHFNECFTKKTMFVSIAHISNLDGVEYPIKEISRIAHEHNSIIAIDAAQSIPHREINVKTLGADFLSFSGHKMLGPTGIGVLYAKNPLFDTMEQFISGGGTVFDSDYTKYQVEKPPAKFEAGLQDYANIIAMQQAIEYINKVGFSSIQRHELKLNEYLTSRLLQNKKIHLIGPKNPEHRSGIFSFNIEGKDPHIIAQILDSSKKIMVRSGAHCVHSWFNKVGINGSVRASFYFYNSMYEAEVFAEEIEKIANI